MEEASSRKKSRPMRADARRNRRQLLDAAIELILEIGGQASRDAVAKRAGVGIATLYRHFPDQQDLLHAVVLDVLDRTIAEGEGALRDAATGGQALRAYLHAAIDTGLGVVNIVHPLLDDTDWADRRAAAQLVLDQLVHAAHADGALADEVTATDVALAAIRFCRPLAISVDLAEERTIAHRQLDTYLNGLDGRAVSMTEDDGVPPVTNEIDFDVSGPHQTTG